ncbi:MAG: ATP-binding protein [candidate division Zixibacteria bacterium]|nr:ATP-binding protein [candidate division Zixibacteria bacterium]
MLNDLSRCLNEDGIHGDLQQAINVAVSEAFTNAVVHGNRGDKTKLVILRLEVNDREITADIVDQGMGGLKQIESRRPSGQLDEGGRGVDLIRHFADWCQFKETDDGGLQVTICFLNQGKHRYDLIGSRRM